MFLISLWAFPYIVTNISQPIATIIAAAITAGAAWYISNNYFKNKLYDKKADALVEIETLLSKHMEINKVNLTFWWPLPGDIQNKISNDPWKNQASIVENRLMQHKITSDLIPRVRSLIRFWFPELIHDLDKLTKEFNTMRGNISCFAGGSNKYMESAMAAMTDPEYVGYDTIALYDNLIDRLRHHLPK